MGVELFDNGNGQKCVRLAVDGSSAEINLFGATLTSYIYQGNEVIFVSKQALFDNHKAIRGGVPVVFPQFGPWSLGPQHGFARISQWEAVDVTKSDTPLTNQMAKASFLLKDSEATRAMWNFAFSLVLTVTLTTNSLSQELHVTNTDGKSFDFTALLHTYLRTDNVHNVSVTGLQGCMCIDKITGQEATEQAEKVLFSQATDRVYCDTPLAVCVDGLKGSSQSSLTVTKENMPNMVLWNPWVEGAKAMADFGDDEYKHMLCVEPGHVTQRVVLDPGKTWTGKQTITPQ